MGDIIDTIQISIIFLIIHVLSSGICNLDRLFLKMQFTGFPAKNVLVKIATFFRSKSLQIINMKISLTLTKPDEFTSTFEIHSYNTRLESSRNFHRQSISNKTLRSVHFGVVVVELINCKCRGIVRNQIW